MPSGHEGVRLDRSLDRVLLEPRGRNGADDPVAVAQRHEVGRDAAGQHQAVLDRLVALRSHSAIWSRPTAAMKIMRFDVEVPLVTQ